MTKYATSFRIKITLPLFGITQYVNGCCGTEQSFKRGELIFVEQTNGLSSVGCTAEVIESQKTQRSAETFGWVIV